MEASASASAPAPVPVPVPEVAAADQQAPAAVVPTGRHMFSSRWTVRDILGREDGGVGLVDQEGVVAGWIRTVRFGNKGKLAFINLNDGSLITGLQVVCDSNKEGFDQLKATDCSAGASIWIFGKVVKSPAKGQTVEFLASKVALVGGCDPLTYPLAGKGHSVEFLREQAHLRARTNTFSAVARVRNGLSFATHQFFQAKGFLNVHTPLITCSDCEGAGEMFQVTTLLNGVKKPEEVARTPTGEINYAEDFFGKPSYLTVSGQLNGEYYACGLGNIYTFGPTFRAENSNTRRHLAEFWMIEPEMAFYDLVDNMDLAEEYVKHCIKHVLTTYPEDMKFLDSVYKGEGGSLLTRLEHVLATPFTRITYTEAIDALLKSGAKFEEKVEWGIDMSSEHERYLTEKVYNTPVIVTDYPKDFKAFYMRLNDDGKTVAAMDVLMPTLGELIGGSQREERLDVLRDRFKEHNLPEEPYKAYLDTRRFGSVPHSGFGLGFERLVLFVSGVENIRDAIPFPRYPKHAQF